MLEANVHLRPLHTSILDIYKVFEPFVYCLKGWYLHPYTVTPAKLAPDLGIQGHLRCGNDATTSCLRQYPPQTASYIHIRHLQSVWAIGMLSQGHMVAPLHHYTGQVGPRLEMMPKHHVWGKCPPQTASYIHIKHVQNVEQLVCCLKGIWVHPYTVTPAKLPPNLGSQVHLRSENVAILHGWG